MGWNYLSIPKLQRCNRWSLGMDKWFHPKLCWTCDYLSMLGLKLNHVSKRGPEVSMSTISLLINKYQHLELSIIHYGFLCLKCQYCSAMLFQYNNTCFVNSYMSYTLVGRNVVYPLSFSQWQHRFPLKAVLPLAKTQVIYRICNTGPWIAKHKPVIDIL